MADPISINCCHVWSQTGRTIITTIHQPSSRMFHMFDKLLLISEGYPIYHGKARESMQYFASLGFVPEIAMNPAEFLLDLVTGHADDISIPEALRGSPNPQEFEIQVTKVDKYLQQLLVSHQFSYRTSLVILIFFE